MRKKEWAPEGSNDIGQNNQTWTTIKKNVRQIRPKNRNKIVGPVGWVSFQCRRRGVLPSKREVPKAAPGSYRRRKGTATIKDGCKKIFLGNKVK